MSPEEFSAVLKILGSASAGAVLGVIIGSLVLRGYLLPYLQEKAKTVASKEDIEDLKRIARELKGVEHSFNESIEGVRLRHQLQLAALERRLEAHQQAPRFRSIEQTRGAQDAHEIWEKIIGAEAIIAREAGVMLNPATQASATNNANA